MKQQFKVNRAAMDLVEFAAGESTRYSIATVCFAGPYRAATDGRVCVIVPAEDEVPEGGPVLVSAGAIRAMRHILPKAARGKEAEPPAIDVTVEREGGRVSVSAAGRLPGGVPAEARFEAADEGHYPPVLEVIPQDHQMLGGVWVSPVLLGRILAWAAQHARAGEDTPAVYLEIPKEGRRPMRVWMKAAGPGRATGVGVVMPVAVLADGEIDRPTLAGAPWFPKEKLEAAPKATAEEKRAARTRLYRAVDEMLEFLPTPAGAEEERKVADEVSPRTARALELREALAAAVMAEEAVEAPAQPAGGPA